MMEREGSPNPAMQSADLREYRTRDVGVEPFRIVCLSRDAASAASLFPFSFYGLFV